MNTETLSPGTLSRRESLRRSASVLAGLAAMAMPDFAFPGQAEDEELVPYINEPRARPNMLDWETLDAWITPQDQVFSVNHYGEPDANVARHSLEITGLVERPATFTLEQIKAMPRRDQLMTLECSGNGSSPGFMGAVYNSKWTGTPVGPVLEQCGIRPEAIEIVFLGTDVQKETLRKGTSRELTVEVPFGRSMSLSDAMSRDLLLAYERNGEPLEKRNGAPLRLIVPGWYGIANVKWLKRIELRDRRYMGRFMGRDYVTVRGERRGGEVVFVETSVTRMNLKSVVARVTRRPAQSGLVPLKAYGAAWDDGTGIAKVEVKLDDGPWQPATLDKEPRSQFSWTFFSADIGAVKPGMHTVVSRATSTTGRMQPSPDDDEIALKRTYWEAYAQWTRQFEV